MVFVRNFLRLEQFKNSLYEFYSYKWLFIKQKAIIWSCNVPISLDLTAAELLEDAGDVGDIVTDCLWEPDKVKEYSSSWQVKQHCFLCKTLDKFSKINHMFPVAKSIYLFKYLVFLQIIQQKNIWFIDRSSRHVC